MVKVKLHLMEVVPGKEMRSWHHPFLFQWLPSSELALASVGFTAERRWFPTVSTLLLSGSGLLPAESYAESDLRSQLVSACTAWY